MGRTDLCQLEKISYIAAIIFKLVFILRVLDGALPNFWRNTTEMHVAQDIEKLQGRKITMIAQCLVSDEVYGSRKSNIYITVG